MSNDLNKKEDSKSFNKSDSSELSNEAHKEKEAGCTLYERLWKRKYLIGSVLAILFWRNRYYSTKFEWPISKSLKNNMKNSPFTKSKAYENL